MANGLSYNGKQKVVLIDFNQYSGSGFVDVVKVVDRAEFKIMNSQERKSCNVARGGADVVIRHKSGEAEIISRQDLVNNYRLANNNKKIVFRNVNSRFSYNIVRQCKIPYKAMLIPKGMVGTLNGKLVNPGNYIVCRVDDNGNLSNSKIELTRKEFRKMFIIPMQDVISRNRNKKGITSNKSINPTKIVREFSDNPMETGITTSRIELTKRNNPDIQIRQSNNGNTVGSVNKDKVNNNATRNKVEIRQNKYKYKAVGRVEGNVNGKIKNIGFILIDLKGKTYKFSEREVMMLCSKHEVINLSLVKDPIRGYFLKGNGIIINDLQNYVE